ncbi:MAG: DsbA family protein [Chloroflexota bacterium]|nr:DsbA family protein [Chloroflexota bacterium]
MLALQLAKAAQEAGADVFERYHIGLYDAMQGEGRRVAATALIAMAGAAGVDVARFETEREQGRWLREVARDHREGSERWGVFGTPTLVFDGEAAVYIKFTEPPASPSGAAEVFDALLCLAKCHPELIEIKHPLGAS